MKEEKILKKVGKLLSLYGVSDEEKEKFLLDLKDKKYDDQEEIEETVDEEQEEVVEQPEEEVEEQPIEEEQPVEESDEEKVEDEEVGEEEVGEEVAPVEEEQPLPEQPQEEEQVEEVPQEQPQVEQPNPVDDGRFEELQKANEGLLARIEALEGIIEKMGIPLQNGEDIGLSPSNPAGESQVETEYDRFNRMRMGR